VCSLITCIGGDFMVSVMTHNVWLWTLSRTFWLLLNVDIYTGDP